MFVFNIIYNEHVKKNILLKKKTQREHLKHYMVYTYIDSWG